MVILVFQKEYSDCKGDDSKTLSKHSWRKEAIVDRTLSFLFRLTLTNISEMHNLYQFRRRRSRTVKRSTFILMFCISDKIHFSKGMNLVFPENIELINKLTFFRIFKIIWFSSKFFVLILLFQFVGVFIFYKKKKIKKKQTNVCDSIMLPRYRTSLKQFASADCVFILHDRHAIDNDRKNSTL